MAISTKFENFLINKSDRIDNAAHNLIYALVSTSAHEEDGKYREDVIEWNMEYIGEVVDMVKSYLEEQGFKTCHPYYEDDDRKPCFKCESCTNEACKMRKKS